MSTLETGMLRPLFIILIIALVVLQHKLWLGDGNLLQWIHLEQKLEDHHNENNQLAARNRALEADIKELKDGEQALEEQARYELGMIRKDEEYYRFVD